MTRLKVAIVQEYVPTYRLPFFGSLAEELRKSDIEVIVIAGTPTGTQALRRDATSHATWLRHVEPHHLNLKHIDIPYYGTSRHWKDCDGVIFTLRANSFDLNAELLKRPFSRRRVGAWGHVKSYVGRSNALKLAFQKHNIRQCDHLFAYTQSGADFAIDAGANPGHVTAVMNSVDVTGMLTASESIDSKVVQDFEQQNDLNRGKTFGYIGGIDAAKRIDFLVDVLDILWERDPQIKLVIGGRGNQENLLAPAVSRGQVVPLGYAGPREKALISHVSEAVLNPGRIGLLAIECMALGKPILTTDWKYHGPEFEYLSEGDDVFIAAGGPEPFADLVVAHTTVFGGRRMQPKKFPSLDDMLRNFACGVLKMMN